jgi:hypothetical protein
LVTDLPHRYATGRRRPGVGGGLREPQGRLVAHTDTGPQYTSVAYTERIREFGMEPTIGSVRGAFDCESVGCRQAARVGAINFELISERVMASRVHTEREILNWIPWYHPECPHKTLGERPATEFERVEHNQTPGPCGPPDAVQPAFVGGAGPPRPITAKLMSVWCVATCVESDYQEDGPRSREETAMAPHGYLPESRRRALDLLAAGKTICEVAHDLDVSAQSISTCASSR